MLVRHEFDVDTSAAHLFQLMHDYGLRAQWDTFTRSFLVDSDAAGQGQVVRSISKNNGLSMDTVYVSFQPGKVAAVKMLKGPYIFDTFAGSWNFRQIEPQRTHVVFSYSMSARPRWLSWLLTPVVVFFFQRETRKRTASLQQWVRENRLRGHERGLRCMAATNPM